MDTVNHPPIRVGPLGYLGQVAKELTPSERRRAALMLVVILTLHAIGFLVYNPAITGLSVAIYLFIGTIEVLGLLPTEIPSLTGGFWNYMANFDIKRLAS